MTKRNGKPKHRYGGGKESRAKANLHKKVAPPLTNCPRGPDQRAPRDACKRQCWSIHSETNRTRRDKLVEMVIDLMTNHGGAKSWPATADIFERESQTVMDHIRTKGWLQQHIPGWCAEAILERGHSESKKCPPGGLYPSSRVKKRTAWNTPY